jgi:hypothetical protein
MKHFRHTSGPHLLSFVSTSPERSTLYRQLRQLFEADPGAVEYIGNILLAEHRHNAWIKNGVRPAPKKRHRELFDEWPPGDDHGVFLVDPNDTLAYISEPYGIDTRAIIEFCDEHDLDHMIYPPYATWYPGFTIPVVYTKRGEYFRPYRKAE